MLSIGHVNCHLMFQVLQIAFNVSPYSLKEFLPKEYIKHKGEKKIFQVWTEYVVVAHFTEGQEYSFCSFLFMI